MDLMDENMTTDQFDDSDTQNAESWKIMQIISEATIPAVGVHRFDPFVTESFEDDYMDDDLDTDSELDVDSSDEIVYAMM